MRFAFRFVLPLALLALAVGCVMPDHISQIQKDVADVQQQLRGLQRTQGETQQKLGQIEQRLDDEGEAVSRADFADLRLQFEEIARGVAILDEQVQDTNRRMDRVTQDLDAVRQLARRPAPSSLLPPPDLPPDPGSVGSSTGTPAGGLGAAPSPEALYNAAYADFSKGNYPLAISGFEEYAERFPDNDFADNALYWVGECHFSQGQFGRAIQAFDDLLRRYPESDRAAAADLKKGLAYLEQNQVGQAIVQLRYVLDTYPATDESRIARDKLASLGASAG